MKKKLVNVLQKCLRLLAIIYLRRLKPKIIGITGSVGKTTTKEAIFLALNKNLKDHKVRRSAGNLNNELGLPLSILGFQKSPSGIFWPIIFIWAFLKVLVCWILPKGHQTVLILEMAADKPGDMSYLVQIAPPDIAVVTNIGYAHLQAFGDLNTTAGEKSHLVQALRPGGTAVLNGDDSLVHEMNKFSNNFIYFGLENGSTIQAKDIKIGKTTKMKIEAAGEVTEIEMPFLAEHQIYAVLAAIGVGRLFDLSVIEIIEALKDSPSLKGRARILKINNKITIIDDTYNANPASMEAGLKVLGHLYDIENQGRKIAVLGDMLELGSISETAHSEIGKLAKEEVDILYTVGEKSQRMNGEKHFSSSREAAVYLKDNLEENDIVLVKGSRGIKMDYIIDYLMKEVK